MRAVIHQRGTRLLLGAVVLVAVAAATAYATAAVTSSSATVIVACRNDTNGLLRVVTDARTCRRHETALSWNAQGPPGPPGPPGRSVAFTHVLGGGTIDASRSQNVLALTNTIIPGSNPGIPVSCFDLAVTAKNVVATVENSVVTLPPPMGPGIGLVPLNATVDPSVAAGFGCPAGTDAAVVGPRGNALERLPFYVLFN